jgi:glucan 1,3-beta-glucosidase
MLFRAALSTALVAAPLAVSAAGKLGFAVGNTNPDGSCKSQSDYEADFEAIAGNTQSKLVRTYSSTDQFGNPCDTPSHIMAAAKSAGFQVLLGMW